MKIFYLTAYRGTGKDTLFSNFENGKNSFNWIVYSKGKKWDSPINPKRLSFADCLKIDECPKYYPIPEFVEDKEKKQFLIERMDVSSQLIETYLMSARDIYIEWGLVRRNQDLDYWVKKIQEKIEKEDGEHFVITDWRYKNEFESLEAENKVTIRLFRSSNIIPEKDVISEHELDSQITDFLFVPSKDDFQIAIQHFPQYLDYERIASV